MRTFERFLKANPFVAKSVALNAAMVTSLHLTDSNASRIDDVSIPIIHPRASQGVAWLRRYTYDHHNISMHWPVTLPTQL